MGVETGNTNRINYKGTHDFSLATVLGISAGGRASGYYNVLDNQFANLAGDGTTDESANWATILAGVYAAGGGLIYFPGGKTYKFLSQWVIPNDGAGTPSQPSIIIEGGGSSHNGQAGVPSGGAILDLRATTAPAKIDTRGLGHLVLRHLTFKDGGSVNTAPFIQTTNTTLLIEDCEFYGTGTTQDAIVLGGTSTTLGGGSNAPFQGYGTRIIGNYFNKIQRGVYGRTYCNGCVIQGNIFWNQCGGGAAIELVGLSGSSTSGNQISDNLIEATGYTYCIVLNDYATLNTVAGNSFYDPTGVTAYIRCTANSAQNLIIGSFYDASKPLVSDASSGPGRNSVIDAGQSLVSTWNQPWTFGNTLALKNSGNGVYQYDNSGGFYWLPVVTGSNGVQWIMGYFDGTTRQQVLQLYYADANNHSMQFFAPTEAKIDNTGGALRVRSKSGVELWLGDVAGNYGMYLVSGVPYLNGIATFNTGENHKFRSPTVNVGGTTTVDFSTGQLFFIAMGAGNTTVSPSNIRTGLYTLDILQDGTGSRLITWQSQFKFPGGTAPTLSTGAGKRDVFVFQGDQNNNALKLVSYQLDVR